MINFNSNTSSYNHVRDNVIYSCKLYIFMHVCMSSNLIHICMYKCIRTYKPVNSNRLSRLPTLATARRLAEGQVHGQVRVHEGDRVLGGGGLGVRQVLEGHLE